jgi:hypothetical protein
MRSCAGGGAGAVSGRKRREESGSGQSILLFAFSSFSRNGLQMNSTTNTAAGMQKIDTTVAKEMPMNLGDTYK